MDHKSSGPSSRCALVAIELQQFHRRQAAAAVVAATLRPTEPPPRRHRRAAAAALPLSHCRRHVG